MPDSSAFIILLEVDFFQLHCSDTGISRDIQEIPKHMSAEQRLTIQNLLGKAWMLFRSCFKKQSISCHLG